MENRKFISYVRVSKDSHKAGKSRSEGLGLDAQRNIIQHFYGENVVKEFIEVKSAKNIHERPVLREAIQYALENNLWMCLAKLDRLSRDVDHVRSILKQMDGQISFCDIPSEGKADIFTITIYAAFAERERELISLRTKQALQAKLKREGPWQKGNPDFTSGEANKKAVLACKLKAGLNENTIRASEIIADKRKAGMTYEAIASLLNEKKFASPTGMDFHPMQVYRIHQRETIGGLISREAQPHLIHLPG